MEAIPTRTGDALARSPSPIAWPSPRSLFAKLAQSLAERVTLPQSIQANRDLPPEWFRFPLP
jgi:hypothetical protein